MSTRSVKFNNLEDLSEKLKLIEALDRQYIRELVSNGVIPKMYGRFGEKENPHKILTDIKYFHGEEVNIPEELKKRYDLNYNALGVTDHSVDAMKEYFEGLLSDRDKTLVEVAKERLKLFKQQ